MPVCRSEFSGPRSLSDPVFGPLNQLIKHNDRPFQFNADSDYRFSCSECEAQATDHSALMTHYASCHRQVCGVCKRCFLAPEILSLHEMSHCSGFKSKISCPLPGCSDHFDSSEEVANHVRNKHCLSLWACGME
ncbi:hypothetical protein D915_008800 [Fasciola hepatica]|uniref:C2H2-type domain-containing protein n=1 Tax=Fasciola hepatica TaxID=6192 RepID=A0A4E0RHJ9_FASHE|nr:hypothetical protein D915_008800 [Fasciola hepatica]